jgi:phage tail P2-like protein
MSERISLIPRELVAPGVRDERHEAFAQLFGEALAEIAVGDTVMSDPLTVDARWLPHLIEEFGAHDFIEPGLPEKVVRRILANIWRLKALHGYDAGVKLGLSLLGMTAEIEHWWQVEPKRAAGTHDLTFFIGEQLFENDAALFGAAEKRAALRMIDATKRWSQETTVYVGARISAPPVRSAMRLSAVSVTRAPMRFTELPKRFSRRARTAHHLSAISVTRAPMRLKGLAS